MKSYKLRAECLQDITSFFNKLFATGNRIEIIKLSIMEYGFPDAELEFKSKLEMSYLRKLIKDCDIDSHVMVETFNYLEDYTGIRD